ncbi:MAG: hypothetical protein QM766_06260 [Burkholderiaceae bacterium]
MAERQKAERPSTQDKQGLLYPYWQDGFSRGLLIALVPALIGCVITRAPQFRLSKILGTELPISFDAITIILVSPYYFAAMTWLLLNSARRSSHHQEWYRSETNIVRGLTILFGISALFLLAQFFLVLAPVGTCDQRPHWELLCSIRPAAQPISHCMNTADEINKTAWYYLEPVFLQAWMHIVLVAFSLVFLYRAWRSWVEKRSEKTEPDGGQPDI